MDWSINFPNLGIYLDHVGKNIQVFGFEIAFYGMIIALGMMIAVFVISREASRTGQNQETYLDMVMYTIILSVIGARLYYVIFNWSDYKGDIKEIINLRHGGLAIYGGVITGVIVVFIFTKIKKMSFTLALDTCVMGLLIGQIMGRWGNFFNREAFGEYTNNLLAMQLPVSAVRSAEITDKMWANVQVIDEIQFIQVHPTFLYESLWNLAILLFIVLYRKKKKFDGELFLLYAGLYGIGRAWIEGLRTDQLLLPVIGWPVSQVLAVCFAVVSAIVLIYNYRLYHHKKEGKHIEK